MPTIAQQLIEEGKKQGIQQEILESIELALELKFGDEGLREFNEISKIKDVSLLRTIRQAIRTVRNVNGLRRFYR